MWYILNTMLTNRESKPVTSNTNTQLFANSVIISATTLVSSSGIDKYGLCEASKDLIIHSTPD